MKKYPLKHISLRVPWHDSGWNGCVCNDPKNNLACLRIKNITLSKNENSEHNYRGREFTELEHNEVPPCLGERGSFMSQSDYISLKQHPYVKQNNPKYKHF